VRPVRHQPADRPVVAGRREPARDHHLHGVGDLLDLLQDVRAEQDSAALLAESAQQVHHLQPLPGVEPVERLVQQQHLRVVHQRRGDPGPLAHSLGVGADPPVLRRCHLDQPDRACGGCLRVRKALQPRAGKHELGGGQERVRRLLLADQPEQPVDPRVAPGRCAADRDGAAGRRQQPGHQVQHGGLAGAVRPEQAGHAGPQRHRHVVHRDHVPVPQRGPVQLDVGHDRATFRYRSSRSTTHATTRPAAVAR
jgi:hypothetical protein